jgi:hypothetical protein
MTKTRTKTTTRTTRKPVTIARRVEALEQTQGATNALLEGIQGSLVRVLTELDRVREHLDQMLIAASTPAAPPPAEPGA